MRGLWEIFPTPEEGVFEVGLNPDHAVFRGHFPNDPVLPGVCSLMIVRECASRMVGRSLRYAAVRESKFLSVITPSARLTAHVILTDGNLSATIRAGQTTMLKLKATLEPDE